MSKEITNANRLTDVLRVLAPHQVWVAYHGAMQFACATGVEWNRAEQGDRCFNPESKDDLLRVVAMLPPQHRGRFATAIITKIYNGPPRTEPQVWVILTAPASTILDALHWAVCQSK